MAGSLTSRNFGDCSRTHDQLKRVVTGANTQEMQELEIPPHGFYKATDFQHILPHSWFEDSHIIPNGRRDNTTIDRPSVALIADDYATRRTSAQKRPYQHWHASPNYQGDVTNPNNQSAPISVEESTSVFITGLPPRCNPRLLLGSIRGCGKIYQCSINPPDASHRTSAAKVVFWDRPSLDRFLQQASSNVYSVDGYTPNIQMNRTHVESRPAALQEQSRVIEIRGPSAVVNSTVLERLFREERRNFFYEVDRVVIVDRDLVKGFVNMQVHFASFRCQASIAFSCLVDATNGDVSHRNLHPDWRHVVVRWGSDPCAS